MSDGGTIRITPRDWETLTKLAVNCSVKLQKPINQATVLKAIMFERMPLVKTNETIEMVKNYLDNK